MESLRPSTIIIKKAGHEGPTVDFLTAAITDDVTGVGFAVQEIEDGQPSLFFEKQEGKPEASDLIDMLSEAKDKNAIIWLGRGSYPSELDVQPIMFKYGEEDLLAIFLEGDFPKHTGTKEKSSGLIAVEEGLFKPLGKIMKMSIEDGPDAFFAELRDDMFTNTALANFGHRGVIAMLPPYGDPIVVQKNELGGEYDWGICTQVQDLVKTEEPKAEESNVVPIKKSFLGKAKAAVQGTMKAAADTITPPKNTEKPPVIQNQPKAEEPKGEAAAPKGTSIPIPGSLTNKERQKFIRRHHGGNLPKGWRQMTTVLSFDPADIAKAGKIAAEIDKKSDAAAAAEAKTSKSTTREKFVASGAASPITPEAAEASMMTLTKDEREKGQEFILKYLDYNSENAPNPLDIQKIEAKYGSFSKQLGFEPERMFHWPLAKLEEFFKRNHKFGFLAFIEMRRRAMVNDKLKVEDVVGTSTKTDEKPAVTHKVGSTSFLSKRKIA